MTLNGPNTRLNRVATLGSQDAVSEELDEWEGVAKLEERPSFT